MKLRAERKIITFLLIILIVNIQVFICQEDNSSPDKTGDKVRKLLSKSKEKLNKYKQIKQANSSSTLDSDDDDTKDTIASIKTTTATTTRRTSTTTSSFPTTRRTTSTTEAPEVEPEVVNIEDKLLEDLLSRRRNKNSRPKKNWTEPVMVKIGMALIHIGIFLTTPES